MKPLEEMGKFATVVVDPPWDIPLGPTLTKPTKYLEKGGYPIKPTIDYGTMSIAEIAALPLGKVLESDSLLFCWATNRTLRDAFGILEAWGVKYAFTMTWVKSQGPQFPNGPCHNAEWILVGKHGQPQFAETIDFRTANSWHRKYVHSEKPEGFYDLLRRVTPGPRLDVFGRRRIAGFQSWGNEAPEGDPLPDHYQQVLLEG